MRPKQKRGGKKTGGEKICFAESRGRRGRGSKTKQAKETLHYT
jgi:hypothetical protein